MRHYKYHDILNNGTWTFAGREICRCSKGQSHWAEELAKL